VNHFDKKDFFISLINKKFNISVYDYAFYHNAGVLYLYVSQIEPYPNIDDISSFLSKINFNYKPKAIFISLGFCKVFL